MQRAAQTSDWTQEHRKRRLGVHLGLTREKQLVCKSTTTVTHLLKNNSQPWKGHGFDSRQGTLLGCSLVPSWGGT